MAEFVNNAIFWIELEKIKPNPYQPRMEFDQAHLLDLSDSIRQYGVLQPLVVTRKETERPDGGMDVEYELIAVDAACEHQTGRRRACAVIIQRELSIRRSWRWRS